MIFDYDLNFHDEDAFLANYENNLHMLRRGYGVLDKNIISVLSSSFKDLLKLEYLISSFDFFLNENLYLLDYLNTNRRKKKIIKLVKEQYFFTKVLNKNPLFFNQKKRQYHFLNNLKKKKRNKNKLNEELVMDNIRLMKEKKEKYISIYFSFISKSYPENEYLSTVIRLNQKDIFNIFLYIILHLKIFIL